MTELKFRSEMRRAETMRKTNDDPMMSEYWAGYIRGLRRAYHGDKFGTAAEHKLWMAAFDGPDESRKQRGRGYRDGLAFGDISSRMGRPPVAENVAVLDKITVPSELKNALEKQADERGISVTDARREAYREYVDNHLKENQGN
jgi:hypothetical protein